MSYTTTRDTLVTHLVNEWQATLPSVPLFFENTVQIDLDKVGDVFVACEVDFLDTVQADLGSNPSSKIDGELLFRVFLKEGQGTRQGLVIWDHLQSILQRRTISGIVVETTTPGRTTSKGGWTSMELVAPFHLHSFY